MALTRLLGGWIAVVVWLLLWELVASSWGRGRGRARGDARTPVRTRVHLAEALLLTLLGGLWFASLGRGGWWLVFGLVGLLREYPSARSGRPSERPDPATIGPALLRVARTVAAGGLLAWRLGPA